MLRLLLVLIAGFFALSAKAETIYEYQVIEFENGKAYYAWVNYNEDADQLLVKYEEGAEPRIISADEVTRFTFHGSDYVSLTFMGKFNTFYKIQFEGEELALLEKKPTTKMLKLLAEANELVYYEDVSETAESQPVILFQQNNALSAINFSGAKRADESNIKIEKLVFIATPEKFDLFLAETNQFTAFWSNYWQHKPNARQVRKLLAPYMHSERRLNSITEIVSADKIDLRDTTQLVAVLKNS
jgi:hypothetical protein